MKRNDPAGSLLNIRNTYNRIKEETASALDNYSEEKIDRFISYRSKVLGEIAQDELQIRRMQVPIATENIKSICQEIAELITTLGDLDRQLAQRMRDSMMDIRSKLSILHSSSKATKAYTYHIT